MYKEERVVNGVLCWRGTPNGEWTQYTAEEITARYLEIKGKLRDAKDRIEQLEFVYEEY